MKRFFAALIIIACISIIIVGLIFWDKKTDSPNDAEKIKSNETVKDNQTLSFDTIRKNIVNLPENTQELFKESYVNQEKVSIVIVGSELLESQKNGWSAIVEENLEMIYNPIVDVKIEEFAGTSTEFINSDFVKNIIKQNPDIVLLEGFTLTDNIKMIPTQITLSNIKTFINKLLENNPNVQIIIQPSNPIYTSGYYPDQMIELQQFAQNEKIPFLNHWELWPNLESTEITEFLNDGRFPNEKGHQLWANAVIDYFANDWIEK